ncbi:hypothetical protein F5Y18DRAFT_282935 [Xylariaceae sp. FL1019]|nr:hypothetical protein F5Y18DRAFT_282935 [Xylariaceae sp. FL1019]
MTATETIESEALDMSASSSFRFFDLPAELRTDILSHLLVSKYGVVLHNRTLFGPPMDSYVYILYIFLVNVQMYQEASAIFYNQNQFVLNAQSHRLPTHLKSPGGFLSQGGQDGRRRVQALALLLTRVGGEFEDILSPAISDMILRGSLRRLKICLGPPTSHPTKGPGSNIFSRPPFKALLKLLTDPDLHHVELLVWKVHWDAFCPFHGDADIASKTKVPSESVDGAGLATVRGSSDWIKLDWETMASSLGTGQRIVKIGERDL